jgi:hypothetical protein
MKRLVEFPSEDGGSILVEVDDTGPSAGGSGGTLRSVRPAEMIERAQVTYEEAFNRIKPATEVIVARMRLLPDPPDEIFVEFGIKLSAAAGAILASASADAQFTLRLTWRRGEHGPIEPLVPVEALPAPGGTGK